MSQIYLIWIELDVKLLGFLALIAILISSLTLAVFVPGRRWHEYVTAFFALFFLVLILSILVCNYLVDYPVFTVPKFQKAT